MRKVLLACALLALCGCAGVDLELGVSNRFKNDLDLGFGVEGDQDSAQTIWAAVVIQLTPKHVKVIN